MKVKCEINLDLSNGKYDITFAKHYNERGEIDWNAVKQMLQKVFKDVDKQVNLETLN